MRRAPGSRSCRPIAAPDSLARALFVLTWHVASTIGADRRDDQCDGRGGNAQPAEPEQASHRGGHASTPEGDRARDQTVEVTCPRLPDDACDETQPDDGEGEANDDVDVRPVASSCQKISSSGLVIWKRVTATPVAAAMPQTVHALRTAFPLRSHTATTAKGVTHTANAR